MSAAGAIRVASSPGEARVAVVTGGGLADYAIWRPGAPDGVGDLHRGRVTARVPALAGAFVALAGVPDGFLPDSEGGAGVTVGDPVGVRITRAAQGGKGPRLSARLDAADRQLVRVGPPALVRRGPDPVMRLAAQHPALPVRVNDTALAARLRPALGERVLVDPAAFDAALEAEVAALADPAVLLPGGVRASIHPTPALVAIDLDTAAAAATGREKTAAHLAANRAALPALARQIRLRNLSGAILIDPAGLSPRRRAALGPDVVAALAADPLRPRFLGVTGLGLIEIVRSRVHPALHELLAGPLAAGLAALRVLARTVAADPAWRPMLRAAPAVVAALQADPEALADLARRAGRPLMLRSDPTLPPEAWVAEE